GIRDDLVTGVQTCALPIYCKQLRVVFFVAERDPLAKRAAVRPVTPGQIFVHHTDAFRAVGICRGEEASFAQVNTEGREVLAVNRSEERRVGKEWRRRVARS